MSGTDEKGAADAPGHGVIVRAANGDVIRYDPTGLVMRLSDLVIADIALRLGASQGGPRPGGSGPEQARTSETGPDATALEDIDAWDIRTEGAWHRFTARLSGRQGVRGFRRHVDGGAILGDGPGPLQAVFGLGGASAALASPGASTYPHHVVAPADDIGAVGMAGIETAMRTDRLEPLRECTHEAFVAETLLDWRMDAFAPLPLFVVRAETEAATTAAALAGGKAVENLGVAAENLAAAAASMNRKARVAAVCLDYGLEDASTSAASYRDGMLATMDAVAAVLGRAGFDRPLFVARVESGLPEACPAPVLEGQWELAWNHGDHRLVHSAPAYMFERDAFDRATDTARRQMAEMTAAAIVEAASWRCPVLHLAEREASDASTIRVIAQGEGDLVLDANDPLGAGATRGFRLIGDTEGASVTEVVIAPDDARAVLIRCDRAPRGADLRLAYAITLPGDDRGATGALRDGWSLDSRTGVSLHRWALPAVLPVTGGARGK